MNDNKIALVIDTMSIGGIPKASIPFMKELLNYAEVSLILTNDKGQCQNEIPQGVHTYIIPYTNDISKKIKSTKGFINYLCFMIKYIFYGHISKRFVKNCIHVAKNSDYILDKEFDCAIAYHGMNIHHLTRVFYNIKAKKKIAWIHGDHPFEGIHKKDIEILYNKFHSIVCVSKVTENNFLKDFPSLRNKTKVYYNLFDVDKILKLSKEEIEIFEKDKINIVTVGRLSKEKGQEFIPSVVKELINNGYIIKWYIVGDGEDRKRIENLTKELKLEDYIKFVGFKNNPYPYIKNCDIYVQPSYTEGYPLTIFESAILNKPIIATDVGGTKEHLTPNKDYIEVKPNVDYIYNGVISLIDDEKLRNNLVENLRSRDLSNKNEVNLFVDGLKN